MINNTSTNYGIIAKSFHWIIGVAIISMIAVGMYMTDMKDSDTKWMVYDAHKATGVVIFILASMRFLWRMINPVPELPKNSPVLLRFAANVGHYTLYALMFGSPISGLILSLFSGHAVSIYGLYTIAAYGDHHFSVYAKDMHDILGTLWIIILSLHVTAALYHHFVRKDNILKRMLPFTG